MKKNKFQKGKSLAIAVFGLAAVAVVGVGFSSWVISFRSANQTADVNVEVANTNGNVVVINQKNESTWFASGSTGNFVLDSTEKSGGAFLNSEGTLKTCVLQQTVEFVVYVSPSATNFSGVYAKFGPSVPEENTNFTTAITNHYLEASLLSATQILGADGEAIPGATVTVGEEPTLTSLTTVSSTVTTVSEESIYKGYKKAEVSLTFGFAWGSAFAYVNPTIYFNDEGKTGGLTKDAPTALAALTVVSGIDPKNNSGSNHAPFTLTIGLTESL